MKSTDLVYAVLVFVIMFVLLGGFDAIIDGIVRIIRAIKGTDSSSE